MPLGCENEPTPGLSTNEVELASTTLSEAFSDLIETSAVVSGVPVLRTQDPSHCGTSEQYDCEMTVFISWACSDSTYTKISLCISLVA